MCAEMKTVLEFCGNSVYNKTYCDHYKNNRKTILCMEDCPNFKAPAQNKKGKCFKCYTCNKPAEKKCMYYLRLCGWSLR